MGRRLPVLFFVVVLVAFALGWRSGVFEPSSIHPASAPETTSADSADRQAAPSPSVSDVAPTPSAPAAPVAPTPSVPQETAAQATPDPAAKPSFDVVRVEPDGSAVIAGRAAPGRSVVLMNGAAVLGEARSGAGGEFVIDLTLPTGEHRLRLAERGEGAASVLSDEAAIVNVPAEGRANDLLVMMERPGQASEILVRPSKAEPQVAAVSPPSSTSPARDERASVPAADPAPQSGDAGPSAATTTTAPTTTGAATPGMATTAEGTTVPLTEAERRLAVEAVEIENGRLFVAGSADPRSTIRIYLDDKLVTETRGGEGDRFIGSALAGVAVGDHVIRVDEISPDGRVVARAEVPFNRPDLGSMSAVASSGQPTGETERTASGPSAPVAPASSAPEQAARASATEDTATSVAEAGLRTSVQAPLETVQARVIIRRGDSLWRISRTTYGRGSRYSVIYLANGDQIRNPDRIYPGQVLKLPKDEAADEQG